MMTEHKQINVHTCGTTTISIVNMTTGLWVTEVHNIQSTAYTF